MRGDLRRASTLRDAGRLTEAVTVASRALAEARELGYPPLVAESLGRLGGSQRRAGRTEDAEASLVEAYTLAIEQGYDREAAGAAIDLASLLGAMRNDFDGAEQWLRHSAALLERADLGDAMTRRYHSAVGMVALAAGDAERAQEANRRALEYSRRAWGEESTAVYVDLQNVGTSLAAGGDYESAEHYLGEALELGTRLLGDAHPHLAVVHVNLGHLADIQGNHAGSKAHYEQTLAILEATVGERDPNFSRATVGLGLAAYGMGDFDGAVRHYLRGREIIERTLGDTHRDYAAVHENISNALRQLKRYDEALDYAERAQVLYERLFGERHADTLGAMDKVGDLLIRLGRDEEAIERLDAAVAAADGRRVLLELLWRRSVAEQRLGREAEATADLVRAREIAAGQGRGEALEAMLQRDYYGSD